MIFLVGFMGSGKSTAGKLLAGRLHCPFVDLDERIEAVAGPIAKIFDQQGEPAFRAIEHEQLRALVAEFGPRQAVAALGGGAFVPERNFNLIEQSGAVTVWLDAPPELLLERCRQHSTARPLARDAERFVTLYRQRLPSYARAQHRISTASNPENVVEEILKLPRISSL